MAKVRCPICGRPFESQRSRLMPFCSERCRRIDLQRWLDEVYGLPYEANDESEERDEDSQGQ